MQQPVRQNMPHTAFVSGYIWVALTVALGVGFSIGAHLAFTLGFGLRVGKGVGSFIQTHGHVQMLGWVGLFIMGVSLYFLPRLASAPLAFPALLHWILWLMTVGLGIRSLGQPVLAYLQDRTMLHLVSWLLVGSGVLTWSGIVLYLFLLFRTCYWKSVAPIRPALRMVRPYMIMMALGWMVYGSLNLGLLVHMVWQHETVLHGEWHRLAIDSMLVGVFLPVAFAVSLRTFPLYLRLAPVDWPVQRLAYAYGIAVVVQLLPTLPPLLALAPRLMTALTSCGIVMKSGVILWFVWRLDILTRRRAPWTAYRQIQPGPERRPTRPGLPDAGEFGCFERLLSAAYAWLVLGAFWEGVMAGSSLFPGASFVPGHIVRHMYFLGFITLLLFGMAVRMLPGFWQQRRVARPALVQVTFWLGNAAALGRVLPFLLPAKLAELCPGLLVGTRTAFALSGLLGLAAVACLAANLWKTAETV